MPITTTLVLCSCLYASNPAGDAAMKQGSHLQSVQQQVAAIKASPLNDREKGRQLAQLLTGLPDKKVETWIGDPEGIELLLEQDLKGVVRGREARLYSNYGFLVVSDNGKVTKIRPLR